MNVIVVVSDSLRRDHLPCYGNRTVHAPRLAAFARQAVVFEGCRPASFPTVPARADLLTGRHSFVQRDWGPLPQSDATLAGSLAAAGYLTFGVADTPFLLRNGYGYDRGFHDFVWIRGQRQGPERDDVQCGWRGEEDRFAPTTLSFAARWLERHARDRFFLYVDTWDPHEPWDAPTHYVRRHLPDYSGEQVAPCYWDWREDGYTERQLEVAHACYMAEIAMVDRWFGFLLDRVGTLGLEDDTAIFFLSDHGFYFGEHGLFGKSRFRWEGNVPFEEGWIRGLKVGYVYRSPLHQEVVRVPLLARIPGVAPGRVDGLCGLPDLMPTILDLTGVEIPETVQGASLLPLVRGEVDRVHQLWASSAALHNPGAVTRMVDDQIREVREGSPSTITDGEWELLYSTSKEPAELYRCREDPGHRDNLLTRYREVAVGLHRRFLAWLEEMGAPDETLRARRQLADPVEAPPT
jgi:arylsulfatase A-like enzyme